MTRRWFVRPEEQNRPASPMLLDTAATGQQYGPTYYTQTPWGLFTQQQLIMNFAIAIYCSNSPTVLANGENIDFNTAFATAQSYYNTFWPLCEGTPL